jgi:hypothetical protein
MDIDLKEEYIKKLKIFEENFKIQEQISEEN